MARYLIKPAGEQLWLIFDVMEQKDVAQPLPLASAKKGCHSMNLTWEEEKHELLRVVNGRESM